MPSEDSVKLAGIGPQTGVGMPFGGPYSNVYGFTPESTAAQDAYWAAMTRGYQNQGDQLIRDAFGSSGGIQDPDISSGVSWDPVTGKYTFDANKVTGYNTNVWSPGDLEGIYQKRLADTNEDRVQARQQLEAISQQRAAMAARLQQQQAESAGFQRELARYQSPNLLTQMVNPQMQAAAQQAMAAANASGNMGGSMAQAANRRAAMMGMGQAAASAVPQAAVAQAGQDFQWQKAREGMINNYYAMQQERAQRDFANEMTRTGFLKGLEEYEHSRNREDLLAAGSFMGNAGAFLGGAAPFFKGNNNNNSGEGG